VARPRAADHEDKRQAILARAAELFALHGYDRASLAMIAQASGVSKALVYHYWPDKEAMLFDVLAGHLQRLVEVVRAANDPACHSAPPGRARLEAVAAALLEAYRDADAVHRVQITCMPLLTPAHQDALRSLERALVAEVTDILLDLSPLAQDRRLLKPLAMSFFAMLNWHYLWHREDGPLTRADYARMAAALVADGLPGAARAVGAGRRAAAE
jgi:TetR/AcrR family transcriptional regulator